MSTKDPYGRLRPRAQSSMEYLMTYGWAILILAIVVGVLFALGLFNGAAATPNGCSPQPDFTCSNPVYTPNGITATISQDSGQNYYNAWAFVASESENIGSGGLPQNFSESITANMVSVGTITPGESVTFNFPYTAAGDIPTANIPVGTAFTGYIWLGYCLSPVCPTPTNFARIGTMSAKASGAGTFQSVTSTISSSTTSSTSTSTTTTSTTTTIGTTFNPTSGYNGGNNIIFNSSANGATLTGNILTTASIKINGGVSITSAGYVMVAGSNFINFGIINAGLISGSGGGSSGVAGESFPSSFAGSGGGGTNYGGGFCQGNGGSTLASGGAVSCGGVGGNGATPSAPIVTNANIITWFTGGFVNYLSGGGGGAGSGTNWQAAGASSYGIYIQANALNAGTINANGANGVSCGNPCSASAGGGGGAIMLAHGSGTYTPGFLSESGGSGGSCSGCNSNGGSGGAGQTIVYQWSTPPVPP